MNRFSALNLWAKIGFVWTISLTTASFAATKADGQTTRNHWNCTLNARIAGDMERIYEHATDYFVGAGMLDCTNKRKFTQVNIPIELHYKTRLIVYPESDSVTALVTAGQIKVAAPSLDVLYTTFMTTEFKSRFSTNPRENSIYLTAINNKPSIKEFGISVVWDTEINELNDVFREGEMIIRRPFDSDDALAGL